MLNRTPNMFDSQPVILDLLADGRLLWNEEVQELVADHFGLTTEEREWINPDHVSENRPYVSNQTAFALQRLQSLHGYIVKPTRSMKRYRITTSGRGRSGTGCSYPRPKSGGYALADVRRYRAVPEEDVQRRRRHVARVSPVP